MLFGETGVEIPPSLKNIYKELQEDLGCYIPDNGYLEKWARQGVLLLNTVLTVQAHRANSHRGIGWEEFTDAAIRVLNEQDRPIVFLLWGRPAGESGDAGQSEASGPDGGASESAFGVSTAFSAAVIFSRPMHFLTANGLEPIDWRIPPCHGE